MLNIKSFAKKPWLVVAKINACYAALVSQEDCSQRREKSKQSQAGKALEILDVTEDAVLAMFKNIRLRI